MSDSLEAKILDGPRIHYCEADNDDIRKDEEQQSSGTDEESSELEKHDIADLFRPITEEDEKLERLQSVNWVPSSSNTGPKGVIGDYIKKRKQARSNNNQINNINGHLSEDKLDLEFEELLNDEALLQEYISKRISLAQNYQKKLFGNVFRLQSGEELLDAIDNELTNVLVLVHIYTRNSKACSLLNKCLESLANEYKYIKFVTLDASVTKLSSNFKDNGVPALLAYKGGDLVKTLVQLEEFLDQDFGVEEVKELLFDRGIIPNM